MSLKAPGNCLEITFSPGVVGVISENSEARAVLGVKIGVPSGTEWTMWIMLEFDEEEESAATER